MAHWLAFAGSGAVLDMEAEDFGFNNDFETAMENGDILVLSNYSILPQAGGWNDQYEADAEDLKTYLRGLAWARNMKDGTEDESTEGQTTDSAEAGIVNGGNWQNVL